MTEQSGKKRRNQGSEHSDANEGLYNASGGSGLVFRKSLVQATTFLAVVLLTLLVYATIYILLLVFAGILLAVLVDYFGRQLMRVPRIPHWLAVTTVLAVLAALLVLMVLLLIPVVVEETLKLAGQLEESVEQLIDWLQEATGGQLRVEQIWEMEELPGIGQVWRGVAGIFATTIGAITGLSIVVIVGVFIAYRPRLYMTGLMRLVPVVHRPRAAEVLAAVGVTLRRWLLGQLISMILLALSTWIMLALLGIPQAPSLALITGAMTFVPYLGPIIALIPILMISFLESPLLALYVLILYMAIQNVEANVIMPIVFHRTAHIPPALGVISQILFGSLLGFLGFVLAIPLMAVVLQMVKMVYVEDILGDSNREDTP